MVPTSWQEESLARHGVSREVPCSALKGETVPDSLPATPKSPPTRRVPPRSQPRASPGGFPAAQPLWCVGVSRPITPTVPHCTLWQCVGRPLPTVGFPRAGCAAPPVCGMDTREAWWVGGPVGREQQMLCEGSLGEPHLLHVVEFWWGWGTGGASVQSREPGMGAGRVPRAALRMLAAGEPQSRPACHRAGRAEFPCAPSCPALPAAALCRCS